MSAHLTKDMVGYDEMGGMSSRRCGNCANFMYPNHCELVAGKIDSDGVCSEFDSVGSGKSASLKEEAISLRDITIASFVESVKEKNAFDLAGLIALIRQWMDQQYMQGPMDKLDATKKIIQEKKELGEALIKQLSAGFVRGNAR